MPLKAREAAKMLREVGFEYSHTEGSHAFYRRGSYKIPIPHHGGSDLKPWEEASIRSAYRTARAEIKARQEDDEEGLS